ncbi:hypothetical protein MIR68_003523 [Amoeboaphelidium protococcarum]|nr:hypothetical protein MIR68_012196 [Amoeboaphelidium protococcarum]KAI3638441.1 hypothetical protein MIR68_003523 [Amoeboaphelidium protococcarum]KAI3645646.1 hypothetical protein MP228_008574 [Amoeboaphelidium protococcarum]KAI3646260.1 hypothetical protein MP228_009188 [Amoeboaphelidium protococcarum]KAI3651354.1 hypothetical protein MP228_003793 [Amoeboaphelidium protococcarum]
MSKQSNSKSIPLPRAARVGGGLNYYKKLYADSIEGDDIQEKSRILEEQWHKLPQKQKDLYKHKAKFGPYPDAWQEETRSKLMKEMYSTITYLTNTNQEEFFLIRVRKDQDGQWDVDLKATPMMQQFKQNYENAFNLNQRNDFESRLKLMLSQLNISKRHGLPHKIKENDDGRLEFVPDATALEQVQREIRRKSEENVAKVSAHFDRLWQRFVPPVNAVKPVKFPWQSNAPSKYQFKVIGMPSRIVHGQNKVIGLKKLSKMTDIEVRMIKDNLQSIKLVERRPEDQGQASTSTSTERARSEVSDGDAGTFEDVEDVETEEPVAVKGFDDYSEDDPDSSEEASSVSE